MKRRSELRRAPDEIDNMLDVQFVKILLRRKFPLIGNPQHIPFGSCIRTVRHAVLQTKKGRKERYGCKKSVPRGH